MLEKYSQGFNSASAEELTADIWTEAERVAKVAGLDISKFGADHREIVGRIAQFLTGESASNQKTMADAEAENEGLFARFGWGKKPEPAQATQPSVAPIIICGVPGTGKTTFLYVLDRVLRTAFGLADTVSPEMKDDGGRTFAVPKRMFCGGSVSLLSVRKWSEMLHFYAWDIDEHRFDREDLAEFIGNRLRPMRIIFADEVEMSGYSPTLPNLAARNLLVVGTSNQYDFAQLDQEKIPPKIYRFEGPDLRSGDPVDAVVQPHEEGWGVFERLAESPKQQVEQLDYQTLCEGERVTVMLDFRTAVQAPMHETQWYSFLNRTWDEATELESTIQPDSCYVLLLEGFRLDELRTDYNAIIRFVWLFDAIEQLGIGVLVRNHEKAAELSREAFNHMKVTIHTARGVSEEVKTRAIVGIDRAISRIGQAGVRARSIYHVNK